jgi:hypothetical protein
MAGLKKQKRAKDTGSPNLVLVLFLIVFVISNIIFGLWLYFALDEKNRALTEKSQKEKEKTAAQTAMQMYRAAANDLALAMNADLPPDEMTILQDERKKFAADDAAYKAEKGFDTYKKTLEGARNDLKFDDGSGKYGTSYKKEADKEKTKADEYLANLKKTQKDLKDLQDQWKQLTEKQDAYFIDRNQLFDKQQKAILTVANTQTDEMKKLIAKNAELNKQLVEADEEKAAQDKKYRAQIRELNQLIEKKDAERADAGSRSDTREPHALMLDISTGKPLWDDPVGMITAVDAKTKEVTLNIGSAKGLRADQTFNVFAPSKYLGSRAEKMLKGTVEVTRILGPNAAAARITAQFDPEFPLHEGDLLFNLFWGTRVAVTGYIDITHNTSDSPTEQMRQLNDFLYMLARQGIIVDAYLDLTDGTTKGAITQDTRFLIKGDDLRIDQKELAENEPRAVRAVEVNNGILRMRKEAIDRGMFVISARNFATVIGYHPPGAKDLTAFRPRLPSAGSSAPSVSGVGGGGGARPEVQPMPEEKKEKEKADMKEKKKDEDKDKN